MVAVGEVLEAPTERLDFPEQASWNLGEAEPAESVMRTVVRVRAVPLIEKDVVRAGSSAWESSDHHVSDRHGLSADGGTVLGASSAIACRRVGAAQAGCGNTATCLSLGKRSRTALPDTLGRIDEPPVVTAASSRR